MWCTVLAASLAMSAHALDLRNIEHLTDDPMDTTADKKIYEPGSHLIKMLDLKRQFVLFVPREPVRSPKGTPLVMFFHGYTENPWYEMNSNYGLPQKLERYGWYGIFPFALNSRGHAGDNGLGGVGACCPSGQTEEDCMKGKLLHVKDNGACKWRMPEQAGNADVHFAESIISWAALNVGIDATKVFASGWSNGGAMANILGCESDAFRAVAPLGGDHQITAGCAHRRGKKPISYISECGTKDDEAFCQFNLAKTAEAWSRIQNCTGDRQRAAPITLQMSATTSCTEWTTCNGGNFVESCQTIGLGHNPSGHMRPDDTSYVRPASDLDIFAHVFQKLSLLAEGSILQWGHPTPEELRYKESVWPPPKHDDHMHFRVDNHPELAGTFPFKYHGESYANQMVAGFNK
eukprot:gnl/TRDRNA2_/TRDRNA2_86155_c0_seq1.p1 gnl/TRDRNA2_/TRDRNA2_86155_c0~~gnl/TRDRNA2_/TRDRNA2_86155_c0_seq1.p1  ORF type:complete len:405 (-),score=57.56 gnl/TRDRNA2_/TRDRNA2_86155_c0_seq1:38-1252(-)